MKDQNKESTTTETYYISEEVMQDIKQRLAALEAQKAAQASKDSDGPTDGPSSNDGDKPDAPPAAPALKIVDPSIAIEHAIKCAVAANEHLHKMKFQQSQMANRVAHIKHLIARYPELLNSKYDPNTSAFRNKEIFREACIELDKFDEAKSQYEAAKVNLEMHSQNDKFMNDALLGKIIQSMGIITKDVKRLKNRLATETNNSNIQSVTTLQQLIKENQNFEQVILKTCRDLENRVQGTAENDVIKSVLERLNKKLTPVRQELAQLELQARQKQEAILQAARNYRPCYARA